MQGNNIIEQVKTVLGYPVVAVYTPDSSIETFIKMGLDMITATVLKKERFAVPCKEVNLLNKEEVVIVTDVVPYAPNTDRNLVYLRDDFSLVQAIEYFNIYSQGLAIPIAATMTYNQLNNTFNNKFDWHYDRHTGELYATQIPQNALFLAVEGKVKYSRETLTQELENWLTSYVLARLKITEGTIRGKYKEGSIGAPSDGDTLRTEGQTELQAVTEQLQNFVPLDIGRRR